MALKLIVFLPLFAAIIAGLGGRWIGATAAKAITTASLFIGAALSWPIFLDYIAGDAQPTIARGWKISAWQPATRSRWW